MSSNAIADAGLTRGTQKAGRFDFIYNPETGAFLGRTAKSWVLIVLFYTVYYACLAGFFGGMISVFLYGVIPDDKPHLTGPQSLLTLNPGMGFRPQPDVESGNIAFTAGSNATYDKYVRNLQVLYDAYKKEIPQPNLRPNCNSTATDADPTKVCPFDWDSQMPKCLPDNSFGYALGQPCVVLKLNRIFGWLPDPADPAMPHSTVQCFGENAADADNLGHLSFEPAAPNATSPTGYFSNVYFPYLRQDSYRSPLVSVIFENLPANTLVMVECRLANLRNSYFNKMDRDAMVRFDIFMQK